MTLIPWLVAVYAAICAVVYFGNRLFMYFPDPSAVIVPPRFDRYQEVSATIMKVFSDFSPDVEALSLDEAFLDMTGSEQLFGDPESIGRRLKSAIRDATGGLTASVGLSATKYVAKVASACQCIGDRRL